MSGENQNQQGGGKDAKKIKNAYDATFKKVIAILGGENKLMPKRTVGGDVLKAVLIEITKEDDEALAVKVKEKLRNLVVNHVQLKKEIAAKRKELDDLELKKMKEFNDAGKQLFDLINHNDENFKTMLASMGELANVIEEEEEEGEDGKATLASQQ